MKKTLLVIAILIVIGGGIYIYDTAFNKYPEMTDEVVETVGGQEVADKLVANFEASQQAYNEAIAYYEEFRGAENIPDILLFIKYAKDAKYIRKYDLSIEILESVFDYHSTSDIALSNLAKVYEAKGDYLAAIDVYLRFYNVFGYHIEQFHVDIMKNYMALDDKANVIKYYEEYREAGYDNEEIKQYVTTP